MRLVINCAWDCRDCDGVARPAGRRRGVQEGVHCARVVMCLILTGFPKTMLNAQREHRMAAAEDGMSEQPRTDIRALHAKFAI